MKKSAIISAMFTMMLVLTSFSTPLEIGGGGKNPTDGTLTVGGGGKNPTTGTLSIGGGGKNPTDGTLTIGGGGKNPKGTL